MINPWIYRLAVLSIAGCGYWLSVAKTVSLWDCGEFIACIHKLGIAHPPGSPMFMILGKTWEMLLFFLPHIAFRINLLSVFASLFSCLLLFEITYNLSGKLKIRPFLRGPCAMTAALLTAFSDTFWFNAVEAEVYALSMAIMLLEFWIILKWEDRGCQPHSPWILLFFYVCFVGIGVHMYSMLLAPAFLLFIGIKTSRLQAGLGLKSMLAIISSALCLGFIFPGIVEEKVFLPVLCVVCLPFQIYAIRKREITDLPYWAMGLLLCSVIAVTKPFIIAAVLLLGALSILVVFTIPRSVFNWAVVAISATCMVQMLTRIQVRGELTFSQANWDMGACLTAAVIVFSGIAIDLIQKKPLALKKMQFQRLLVLIALIGFSTFLYIPIRSQLNPTIDQNDPENWERLQAFIERKQYGNEGMLKRMFIRRGLWSSQFGYGPNMGFFKYQASQLLSLPGSGNNKAVQAGFQRFFIILLLFFTLYVWIENKGRNRMWRGQMLLLYGICSLGLVVYMNFADGRRIETGQLKNWKALVDKTRRQLQEKHPNLPGIPNPNLINEAKAALGRAVRDSSEVFNSRRGRHLRNWNRLKEVAAKGGKFLPAIPAPVHGEVRARDYFFTPAFILFTLMLSLAIFMALDNQAEKRPAWGRAIGKAGIFISLVSWCLPFASHFKTHDRSRDYIASDFAFNLLSSCPPNAVLFTNGDNDTFPLWYMQQVERLRTDVTVVNFSLANADWYTRQLNQQASKIRLPTLEKGQQFPVPKYHRLRGIRRIPLSADSSIAFKLGKYSRTILLRTQDWVLIETVLFNYPHRPICFTLATPPSETLGLEDNFQTTGLVHILSPEPGLNLAALDGNILNRYRYRHIGSTFVAKHPVARRILTNYRKILLLGKNAHAGKIKELERVETSPAALQREKAALMRYLALERRLFSGP